MTFLTILRRELRSLIASPQSYAIGAAYLIISGIFFVNLLVSTQAPDLSRYYSNVASTLVVLIPIVAMRSFAEERKAGSLDLTLSWPLSRTGLVLGKFVANTLFAWVLISVAWIYVRILSALSDIEVARAAGGYIGMLLLSMAFSALALMVSARSSSPTGAAFLGFGLLLVLWILEFAPGWTRDALRSVAPSVHFESFPRGVLFLENVAYFVIVTVVGVGLAVQAVSRSRPGRSLTSLLRRSAMTGMAAVIVAGTPAMASRIEGEIDLTSSKRNTVALATREVLRRVDGPIRITAFIRPISAEATQLRNVAKQYRSAGADVRTRTVDPDTQPGLARREGITEYNKYILEIDGRRETVDDLNQVTVTSAINRLIRQEPPRACFTIGHGERQTDDIRAEGLSSFAGHLARLAYDVRAVALAGTGGAEELARCSVVVVAGPRVPFLPEELVMLNSYLEADGRLVVLADALNMPRDQVNDLLRPWGLSFGAELVRDLSAIADDPTSIVSFGYASKSPIVARLDDENTPVVMTNSLPIYANEATAGIVGQGGNVEGEPYVTELVRSSHKSWIEPSGAEPRKGPFLLAAVTDASAVERAGDGKPVLARTRVAAVGSADMAANRFFDFLGNRQLLTGLVQWVGLENDLITAHRDPAGYYKLILTSAQRDRVIRQAIVFPALAVLIPLPLTIYRLKRG